MTVLNLEERAVDSRPLLCLKIVAALFSAVLIARILAAFLAGQGSPWLAGLLLTETLTIGLIVLSRTPRDHAITPRTVVYTLVPCAVLPLVSLSPGPALAPPVVILAVLVLALALQVWGKVALGRSFGLLPANRGVVDRGPYGLVRHPIYLSYVLQHLAFLLGMFHWWNLAVLLLANGVQWLRLIEEEKVLARDAGYRGYAARVRWRIIPGLL